MREQKQKSSPFFAHWLLKRMTSYDRRYGCFGDLEEEYQRRVKSGSTGRAGAWYYSQVIRSLPAYFSHLIFWRFTMIQNYFKIAWRSLLKYKNYSFINILGLSIGLAACLLILLYIRYETSYDSYHPHADRIYRVAKSQETANKVDQLASNVTEVAPTLKERFPEVEEAARAGSAHFRYIKAGNQKFLHDKLIVMDPEMLSLFHIPLIAGDPATALNQPDAILITTAIGKKYFGTANPMGKTIFIDTVAHHVTGIVASSPGNTHLKYELIKRMKIDVDNPFHRPWGGWHCMNYIRLKPGTDFALFQEKIRRLPHEYEGEYLEQRGVEFNLFLQPLRDIHLHSHLKWEIEPPGNALYITIFSAVGIFVLLIACINFMNLATARSAGRAGEVGIRKVIGARREQLINQFLGESFLLTFIAMMLAAASVLFIMPLFNTWAGIQLTHTQLLDPVVLFSAALLILLTGIIGGSYPAFILSAFRPIAVLRGSIKSGQKSSLLRKVLVISQFAISIALMIATLLFFEQLQFMKNAPLGFSKEQKLIIEFNRENVTEENLQSVKTEFLRHPAVQTTSLSSSVPGRWMYFWNMSYSGGGQEGRKMLNAYCVDTDFINSYDIQITAGRGFEQGRDNNGWVINEAAVSAFGWPDAETALQAGLGGRGNPIIGVVKDFHFRGLQQAVEPLGIFHISDDYRYLTLTIDTRHTGEVLRFVDEIHSRLFPDKIYEHFFLDKDFETQYQAEERRIRLFTGFAILGVFIACIGLLGMSAFIAEQRTKEIGIRKVLGASVPRIILMLTREFILWVLLSNIIAWPIAWIAMNHWFNDFAYRIDLNLFPFLIAGILTLIIAFFTVAYQAIKAGCGDPVDALKYE
ncbi:ABC transporter permease [bacterium]|nr:ABC transporter permease [bacterium]